MIRRLIAWLLDETTFTTDEGVPYGVSDTGQFRCLDIDALVRSPAVQRQVVAARRIQELYG